MRPARIMLSVPAVLFALLLLLALGAAGCGRQPKVNVPGQRTLKCSNTTITIDPNAKHGVDKDAIYVCEDPGYNQVNWTAVQGAGVTSFSITFKENCPFTSGCTASITNNTPQTVAPQPADHVVVYKYILAVTTASGTQTFDPHVVGGGGN
jgi:hypothetical protein